MSRRGCIMRSFPLSRFVRDTLLSCSEARPYPRPHMCVHPHLPSATYPSCLRILALWIPQHPLSLQPAGTCREAWAIASTETCADNGGALNPISHPPTTPKHNLHYDFHSFSTIYQGHRILKMCSWVLSLRNFNTNETVWRLTYLNVSGSQSREGGSNWPSFLKVQTTDTVAPGWCFVFVFFFFRWNIFHAPPAPNFMRGEIARTHNKIGWRINYDIVLQFYVGYKFGVII